jgi:N-carbamoyl-L-amino-acid hydrolase
MATDDMPGKNEHPAIDPARLRDTIDQYARIGATTGGGVSRLALTDEDREARDLLTRDLEAIDCPVLVDDLGNMRGILQGATALGAIQIASHLDTVIRGGRFDGAAGVLAGLEVLRALRDRDSVPSRSIELINWTNEEGARFEPAMIGSGTATGVFEADWMHARTDREGIRLGSELERIGYLGQQRHRPPIGRAYLELHIEQGPVLDDLRKPVGIVQGILGITWVEITVTGRSDHAGPTPMPGRRDALVAAADIVRAVRTIGEAHGAPSVGTVGRLDVQPNVVNTIPGSVRMSADFRAPTLELLDSMVDRLQGCVDDIASTRDVEIAVDRFWTSTPVAFDSAVIATIEQACDAVGVERIYHWSGAGHDARYAAEVQPAGMIFVRSRGGVSHCEDELSDEADIALGASVLLHAALLLAEDGADDAAERKQPGGSRHD